MPRRLVPLLVVAVALVTALPAAADARVERFVASIKMEQTTKWNEPIYDGPIEGSCDSRYYARYGTEITTFRTTPIRVRVIRAPGQQHGTLAFGSPRKPLSGLPGQGKVKRTYVFRSWLTDGPCRPTPGQTHGDDQDDDATCNGQFRASVLPVVAPGELRPVIRFATEPGALELDDCDAEFAPDANQYLTPIAGRMPWASVFGKDEYVIVRAREEIRGAIANEGRSATTMTWTLRMRRAR